MQGQIDNLGIYQVPQSIFQGGKETLEWGCTEGNNWNAAMWNWGEKVKSKQQE